jgi:hypothetical protein
MSKEIVHQPHWRSTDIAAEVERDGYVVRTWTEKRAKPDVFEPVREQIRYLQAELKRRREQFHELQRQTITDHGYMPLHGQFHAIEEVEREIVRLRARMPPYAVERDGFIELLPVTERINPMEAV